MTTKRKTTPKRGTKVTRQNAFIEALKQTGNITLAVEPATGFGSERVEYGQSLHFLTGVKVDGGTCLDGLVLPRGVAIHNEGVLVLAPPHLYLCQDTDGDGRCDKKVVLRAGLTGQTTP